MKSTTQLIPNFYYSFDGYLLWVAGYTGDNQTDSVREKIKYLTEDAAKFSQMAEIPIDYVKTLRVENSRRFKGMRVFYVEARMPAPNAFQFTDEDFTMNYILTKM